MKLFAASFALWSAFVVFGLTPSHLCLAGSEADAPAHVDSTIAFFYRGFDVYRMPMAKLGSRDASDYGAKWGWDARPDGVTDQLALPERAGKPPLLINWSYLPRPYPPGVFLYFLPEALLKEGLGLSPKLPATLSLIQLLFFAHVFLWFFVSLVVPAKGDPGRDFCLFIVAPLVYLETINWSLHGFYDAAAMIPLLLAMRALRSKKGLETVFWSAFSLFLHFRTLWYLPALIAGAWEFIRQKEYARLKGRRLSMAAAAVLMLGLSAYAFVLVYPWLQTLTPTNFFYTTLDAGSLIKLAYILVPLALIAVPLAQNRAYLVLSCMAWTLVMLVRSPFLQMWHGWYLTPLFALTGVGERSAARTRTFVLLAYLVLSSLAFTYFSFNGQLIRDVVAELAQ